MCVYGVALFLSLSSFDKCELEKKALRCMDTALCEVGIPGLQKFNAELFVMFASSVSLLSFFFVCSCLITFHSFTLLLKKFVHRKCNKIALFPV